MVSALLASRAIFGEFLATLPRGWASESIKEIMYSPTLIIFSFSWGSGGGGYRKSLHLKFWKYFNSIFIHFTGFHYQRFSLLPLILKWSDLKYWNYSVPVNSNCWRTTRDIIERNFLWFSRCYNVLSSFIVSWLIINWARYKIRWLRRSVITKFILVHDCYLG